MKNGTYKKLIKKRIYITIKLKFLKIGNQLKLISKTIKSCVNFSKFITYIRLTKVFLIS